MCSICNGTKKIQLLTSFVDCECVSVPKVEYDEGSGILDEDGSKCWYINGQLHRTDGPACERANGDKVWFLNGSLHREDGPAIERASGSKHWLLNGLFHRIDGPACEFAHGYKEWYIDGKRLSKKEFQKRTATLKAQAQ